MWIIPRLPLGPSQVAPKRKPPSACYPTSPSPVPFSQPATALSTINIHSWVVSTTPRKVGPATSVPLLSASVLVLPGSLCRLSQAEHSALRLQTLHSLLPLAALPAAVPPPSPPTPTLAPSSDQGLSLLMQSAFRTMCSLWGCLCKPFKSP